MIDAPAAISTVAMPTSAVAMSVRNLRTHTSSVVANLVEELPNRSPIVSVRNNDWHAKYQHSERILMIRSCSEQTNGHRNDTEPE
jgi:hypothetical protein